MGTDGIRITIQQPNTVPNPSLEGFDIPPGVSTTIGEYGGHTGSIFVEKLNFEFLAQKCRMMSQSILKQSPTHSLHHLLTKIRLGIFGLICQCFFWSSIGVLSTEVTRLPHPYGNCTSDNMEIDLLMQSIRKVLPEAPQEGFNVVNGSYRIADCRSTCLQR